MWALPAMPDKSGHCWFGLSVPMSGTSSLVIVPAQGLMVQGANNFMKASRPEIDVCS